MSHREFSKDVQILSRMPKGNPGPEETTHKPSNTVSITHMLASTPCALDWVMWKKRYCERWSHLQGSVCLVPCHSLPLSNCSLGLSCGIRLLVAAGTYSGVLTFPDAPLSQTGTAHSLLSPVFPVDTPTLAMPAS